MLEFGAFVRIFRISHINTPLLFHRFYRLRRPPIRALSFYDFVEAERLVAPHMDVSRQELVSCRLMLNLEYFLYLLSLLHVLGADFATVFCWGVAWGHNGHVALGLVGALLISVMNIHINIVLFSFLQLGELGRG